MKIFQKYQRAIGITLWKSVRKYLELWIFPSNFSIDPHTHNNQDIEVLILFARNVIFFRETPCRTNLVKFKAKFTMFKKLSVPAGYIHWFMVSKYPLIALNIATFKLFQSQSAAQDITFIKDYYATEKIKS